MLFFIKIIYLAHLAFFISLPIKTNAILHDWIAVPKSINGEQLWDKKSITKNNDGSLRVLSKFSPNVKNNITQDILYTMDIKCDKQLFRDVSLGSKDFDEFKNADINWKSPNGDKLIIGVINQVCNSQK